jgi:hypothetical protein
VAQGSRPLARPISYDPALGSEAALLFQAKSGRIVTCEGRERSRSRPLALSVVLRWGPSRPWEWHAGGTAGEDDVRRAEYVGTNSTVG